MRHSMTVYIYNILVIFCLNAPPFTLHHNAAPLNADQYNGREGNTQYTSQGAGFNYWSNEDV